jgi:signal transduction histidine kinase
VAGDTTLLGDKYSVYYMQDISKVFLDGTTLARSVALVDLLVLALLGVALFISVRLAVSPLKSLSKATRAMAGGTYDLRIPIKSDDEISELARDFNLMTQAVEEHVSQLKATADDRRMLIANMTHELKTPMTSIIGYSEILLRARLDSKQQELALSHIHNESLRIEALSQKLMRLVALEGERLEAKEEPVSELLDTVKNAVEMLLAQNKQTLSVRCELETLPMDRDLMTGLLTNLIDNARKASPEGSVIVLSAYRNEEGVPVLEVSDSGHGIPAEELPKVMEPFYMVDKQRSRRNNSAGLGLSLCAIIAQVHHAHIIIASTVGVGTSVKVIFGGGEPEAPVQKKRHTRVPQRGRTGVRAHVGQAGRGRPARM